MTIYVYQRCLGGIPNTPVISNDKEPIYSLIQADAEALRKNSSPEYCDEHIEAKLDGTIIFVGTSDHEQSRYWEYTISVEYPIIYFRDKEEFMSHHAQVCEHKIDDVFMALPDASGASCPVCNSSYTEEVNFEEEGHPETFTGMIPRELLEKHDLLPKNKPYT